VIGDWTSIVAARILREETFTRIFCPALADLQFELATQHSTQKPRAYASVIAILTRAAIHDFEADVMLAVSSDVRRTVWRPTLICFVALFLLFLARQLSAGIVVREFGIVTRLPLPPAGDGLEPFVAGVATSIALSCVAYAMVPAVFLFRRRAIDTTRVIALAVVLLSRQRLQGGCLGRFENQHTRSEARWR
jgi:hypothetical protein